MTKKTMCLTPRSHSKKLAILSTLTMIIIDLGLNFRIKVECGEDGSLESGLTQGGTHAIYQGWKK